MQQNDSVPALANAAARLEEVAGPPPPEPRSCVRHDDVHTYGIRRPTAAAIRRRSLGGKEVNVYPPAPACLPPGTHSGPELPQANRQNFNLIWQNFHKS